MDRWIAASEYDALMECLFDAPDTRRAREDGEGRERTGGPDGSELREKVQLQLHA